MAADGGHRLVDTPDDLKYAETHEWVRTEDEGMAVLGITDYAQDALTDVVFVELPEVGAEFDAGDVFGAVESVKSVSELYAPVSGKVVEVNSALEDEPEKINDDPYGDGWLIKLEMSDASEVDKLMGAAAYNRQTKGDDEEE